MTENQETHWRCLSHHKAYYNHDHVHSRLHAAPTHDRLLRIEIVFHVLSPLPGLEHSRDDDIINHLQTIVKSINADYAGKASSYDSARSHHALFQKSRALKHQLRNKIRTPVRISDISLGSPDSPQSFQDRQDPVFVYQQYLRLNQNTGIEFYHSGLKDRIYTRSGVSKHVQELKLQDPQFGLKLSSWVKCTENGGSTGLSSCLNIWIVDLPAGLLGYSTFPWDNVEPLCDGVCISNFVSGKTFATRDGIHYSKYSQYRTFTHEIAHNLGLLHVFNQDIHLDPVTHQERSGDGDFCADTPEQQKASQGCPYDHEHWKTDDQSKTPHPFYQFMNFMDYSDDQCMFLFTPDQKKRMRQVIFAYRSQWIMEPFEEESEENLAKPNAREIIPESSDDQKPIKPSETSKTQPPNLTLKFLHYLGNLASSSTVAKYLWCCGLVCLDGVMDIIKAFFAKVNHQYQYSSYQKGIDPLSACIRLALLKFKPMGTKLSFCGPTIEFDCPDQNQAGVRGIKGSKRDNLSQLKDPLQHLILWYDTEDRNIAYFISRAIDGLDSLKHTYSAVLIDGKDQPVVCNAIESFIATIQNKTLIPVGNASVNTLDSNDSDTIENPESNLETSECKSVACPKWIKESAFSLVPVHFQSLWSENLLRSIYHLLKELEIHMKNQDPIGVSVHVRHPNVVHIVHSIETILHSRDEILLQC